jgi:hypothetical protein
VLVTASWVSLIVLDAPRDSSSTSGVRVLMVYDDPWSFKSGSDACWTLPTIRMAHNGADEPLSAAESAVAAFETTTNVELDKAAVANLRANFWVLHKWGAHQSESHSFVIWWPHHLQYPLAS